MCRFVSVVFSVLSLCGCVSQKEPNIYATKNWEGHYYSVEDFRKGTSDMKLEKGVSVWVISNVTLRRVLKNIEK